MVLRAGQRCSSRDIVEEFTTSRRRTIGYRSEWTAIFSRIIYIGHGFIRTTYAIFYRDTITITAHIRVQTFNPNDFNWLFVRNIIHYKIRTPTQN